MVPLVTDATAVRPSWGRGSELPPSLAGGAGPGLPTGEAGTTRAVVKDVSGPYATPPADCARTR